MYVKDEITYQFNKLVRNEIPYQSIKHVRQGIPHQSMKEIPLPVMTGIEFHGHARFVTVILVTCDRRKGRVVDLKAMWPLVTNI